MHKIELGTGFTVHGASSRGLAPARRTICPNSEAVRSERNEKEH